MIKMKPHVGIHLAISFHSNTIPLSHIPPTWRCHNSAHKRITRWRHQFSYNSFQYFCYLSTPPLMTYRLIYIITSQWDRWTISPSDVRKAKRVRTPNKYIYIYIKLTSPQDRININSEMPISSNRSIIDQHIVTRIKFFCPYHLSNSDKISTHYEPCSCHGKPWVCNSPLCCVSITEMKAISSCLPETTRTSVTVWRLDMTVISSISMTHTSLCK